MVKTNGGNQLCLAHAFWLLFIYFFSSVFLTLVTTLNIIHTERDAAEAMPLQIHIFTESCTRVRQNERHVKGRFK